MCFGDTCQSWYLTKRIGEVTDCDPPKADYFRRTVPFRHEDGHRQRAKYFQIIMRFSLQAHELLRVKCRR